MPGMQSHTMKGCLSWGLSMGNGAPETKGHTCTRHMCRYQLSHLWFKDKNLIIATQIHIQLHSLLTRKRSRLINNHNTGQLSTYKVLFA